MAIIKPMSGMLDLWNNQAIRGERFSPIYMIGNAHYGVAWSVRKSVADKLIKMYQPGGRYEGHGDVFITKMKPDPEWVAAIRHVKRIQKRRIAEKEARLLSLTSNKSTNRSSNH